jgi:hypothetical protein
MLDQEAPQVEAERQRAQADFDDLLKVPDKQRERRIETARDRYRGPVLAELLLAESKRRMTTDAEGSHHFARLAQVVLYRTVGWQGEMERFVRDHNGYSAALASLDLAVLYAEQGRRAELKRLAAEVVLLLQSQEIQRDALAALLLFQQAAQRDKVTVAVIRKVIRHLEHAQRRPAELPS